MGAVADRAALKQRLRVEIHGAVQGVGFRPFVYRLATDLALRGWVINDTRGVFIEAEGSPARLWEFLDRLSQEKPPLAMIQSLETTWLPAQGYPGFEIRHSDHHGARTVMVLPDMATCADCLAEVLDAGDRRARYPFTNCTNCGPRYSIIENLPYDRPHTSMRRFVMCEACEAEYTDPRDRRFHAQPNACARCGPMLAFYASDAQPADIVAPPDFPPHYLDYTLISLADDALRQAASALRSGRILAIKGLGGFHLMVDARNHDAIARLRQRKQRPHKPFALMVRDMAQARTLCEVSSSAETLLNSPQAPIVLLPRRPDAPVAANVAPDHPTLGIMLPYTPLHHLLLRELDFAVVATSGNLSDEPICTDEWEAMRRLGHIARAFLIHNRPIVRYVDDSVSWIVADAPRLLRRARGYAPLPVLLPTAAPTVLAVGAQLKNTVALSVGRQAFISQHIGDLDSARSLSAFERVIADFLRLYEVEPVAIAHDMHPDYGSTRWAEAQLQATDHLISLPVQHHHAHLASCLAENGVQGEALGVTWDGTGYGNDGTIWGGEFLLGDARSFERVATLRPFRLPGGDAAIKAPCRLAFALLWELYGEEILAWEHLPAIRFLRRDQRRLLAQMLEKGVNAPVTTSMGRLFDAVAALLNLHQEVSFEGQAAMALEFSVNGTAPEPYPLAFMEQGEDHSRHLRTWDWAPMVRAILHDLANGVSAGEIAGRFHRTLVALIVAMAREIGNPRVALSGGVFQNRLLSEWAAHDLTAAGFEVLLHHQVPPNDGGISLGQLAVAAAQLTGAPTH